jgi:hypothetical protein
MPYFLAKAGIARTFTAGRGSAQAERLSVRKSAKNNSVNESKDATFHILLFATSEALSYISPPHI